MVGARALHELVEVVQEALLGLLARVISHGDQHGVGWSAMIFLVLFAPLHGGALVLILALGLAFASASVEASVSARPEPLVYRRSVQSGRQVS